eukprot:6441906-Ditylum_brightwellii.AAC.1
MTGTKIPLPHPRIKVFVGGEEVIMQSSNEEEVNEEISSPHPCITVFVGGEEVSMQNSNEKEVNEEEVEEEHVYEEE